MKNSEFAGNYEGPLYARHPDLTNHSDHYYDYDRNDPNRKNPFMTEPMHAKVSEEDYQKVLNAFNNPEPYPDEMLEEVEKASEKFGQLAYTEDCEYEQEQKRQRVLERYNHYYNMECSGLSWGTPITPEFQQAMTLECMLDALRCENLNHEFDVILTSDINALIKGLYQQGRDYLERVKNNGR